MKKKLTFGLLLINYFFFNISSAQLYISNNSFMYNNGNVVYIESDLELDGINSNFYLRNEGQLVQGTTLASSNKGNGKLSVFQEGTVNNYAYNYWCSPVGNASASIGNEDFGISMLHVPITNVLSSPATILPINNYDGISGIGSLGIAPYWIWKLLTASNYSQWIQSAASSTIEAGQGFTMKGTSGWDTTNTGEISDNNPGSHQRYDFRGKPNDGDITINVANTMMTLTGNPYSSAIDLSAFLTDAVNTTGIAYFWEQDKTVNSHILVNYRGGYGTFSPISRGGTGIYVPAKFYSYDSTGNQLPLTVTMPNNSYARYFSPIGQGFLLEGNGSGTTVTMKNAYRVFKKEDSTNSVFEKNSNLSNNINTQFLPPIQSVSGFDYTTVSTLEVPQIRFNTMLNGEAIKQVVLAFDSSATDGIDRAKDAKNPPDDTQMDMYFLIEDKEYVISVIDFDENKRLKIGFKSNVNALVKITVAEMINFSLANNVFLFDNETGIYHDIKNSEFEFPVDSGVTNSRYEITFKDTLLSTTMHSINNVAIVQNNTNDLLSVANPNNLDIKSVALYDISGKLLFDKINLGAKLSYEFSTASLNEGVYIVKLKTIDNQSVAQKIIVERTK